MPKKKSKAVPAEPPNPVGRPSEYRQEFCDLLIRHMAKGLSFESFGGLPEVGVSEKTLFNWRNAYPEFLQSYEIGYTRSKLYWEKLGVIGVINVKGRSLNSAVYNFNMLNRFRWRNKLDEEKENHGPQVNIYQSVMQRIRAKKEQK